jgi:hypothetical protein
VQGQNSRKGGLARQKLLTNMLAKSQTLVLVSFNWHRKVGSGLDKMHDSEKAYKRMDKKML